jgi:predicted HicB family RNase H-like nuclease
VSRPNKNMMQYKGYTGLIEVDEDAGVLFGRVVGLRDVITFQGATVAEARRAFEESVDVYLDFCASRREAPEKPYSGKFLVRVKPELHRRLANEAEVRKTSLNALIEAVLADHLGEVS